MRVYSSACSLADKRSRAGALGGYFLRNPQLQGSGRQVAYIAAVAAFNVALGASQGSMIDNSGAGTPCAALLVRCFALRSRRSCGVVWSCTDFADPCCNPNASRVQQQSTPVRQAPCVLPCVYLDTRVGLRFV